MIHSTLRVSSKEREKNLHLFEMTLFYVFLNRNLVGRESKFSLHLNRPRERIVGKLFSFVEKKREKFPLGELK